MRAERDRVGPTTETSGRSPLPWAIRRASAYLTELDGDAEMARAALEEAVRIAREGAGT